MSAILTWVLDRAKEKSTWAAIVTLAGTITGVALAPELANQITTAGMAIASIIAIVMAEKKKGE